MAAPLELAALGCANGEVLLVRLQPPAALKLESFYEEDFPGSGSVSPTAAGVSPSLSSRPPLGISPFAIRQQQQAVSRSLSGGGAGGSASGGGAWAGAFAAADAGGGSLLVRSLHLGDWGHTVAQTGGVAALAWSPDCRALAVGYFRQGMAVWSASGCRLMCTVRQPESQRMSRSSALAPQGQGQQGQGSLHAPVFGAGLLDCGLQAVAWGPLGYSLIVGSAAVPSNAAGGGGGAPLPPSAATAAPVGGDGTGAGAGGCGAGSQLLEFQLAKSLGSNHRVAQVVAGADEGRGELHMLQVGGGGQRGGMGGLDGLHGGGGGQRWCPRWFGSPRDSD